MTSFHFLASLCGVVYTLLWSISWYPQLWMNIKRKTTAGVSTDWAVYNIVGFLLYVLFTVLTYQLEYTEHLAEAVEWQDVVYASHSLLINICYRVQSWYYDGQRPFSGLSPGCRLFCIITFVGLVGHASWVFVGDLPWASVCTPQMHAESGCSQWSFAEYCGFMKAILTFFKYVPQVVVNYRRQSTLGLTIVGFTLDLSGGVVALFQNFFDAVAFRDTTYITGNIPKILICLCGLFWDGVIILQHFWIYRNRLPLSELRGPMWLDYVVDVSTDYRKPEVELKDFHHPPGGSTHDAMGVSTFRLDSILPSDQLDVTLSELVHGADIEAQQALSPQLSKRIAADVSDPSLAPVGRNNDGSTRARRSQERRNSETDQL